MTSGLDRETLDLSLEAFRDFAAEKLSDDVLLDLDARDEFPVDLVRELWRVYDEGELDVRLWVMLNESNEELAEKMASFRTVGAAAVMVRT